MNVCAKRFIVGCEQRETVQETCNHFRFGVELGYKKIWRYILDAAYEQNGNIV